MTPRTALQTQRQFMIKMAGEKIIALKSGKLKMTAFSKEDEQKLANFTLESTQSKDQVLIKNVGTGQYLTNERRDLVLLKKDVTPNKNAYFTVNLDSETTQFRSGNNVIGESGLELSMVHSGSF